MRGLQALAWLMLAATAGSTAQAAEFRVEDIIITDPWARATAPHVPTGAAYMVVANTSDEPDLLVAARTPAAERVELHTHRHDNGVMRMRPVASVPLEPNSETRFAPSASHLMLVGLQHPLVEGQSFPLTLSFERAGTVQVIVHVAGIGAQQPPSAGQ